MMGDLVRYAKITEKMPREFLLLQGRGCQWRQCTFCDYHLDCSENPFTVNADILRQVTGEFGVLDVINSGSAPEMDAQSLGELSRIIREKSIHTLWLESHYLYREQLKNFAARFSPAEVKFRCGVETFDGRLRLRWKKGIPEAVTPEDVAKYFRGICLLVCVEGQTKEGILRDIELADRYFEYFSVNVFCPNSTAVRQDKQLVEWFVREVYPTIADNPRAEILLNNTDLGVG